MNIFKVLSLKNRLKKRRDFENILRKGKSFREGFLVLKILKNNLKISRFAFVVSKKVSKKSSQRNKIKRRMRAIVRSRIKEIKKGIDGILIASPGIKTKDFREIKEMIDKIFKKADIIYNATKNCFKIN